MPKINGTSPTTIDLSSNKQLLCNIPEYGCGALLSLVHIGASGTIYFKTGCGENDTCDATSYEDKLVAGEVRYIDNPTPGRVLVFCSVTPNAQNIAWHAGTRN